MMEVSWFVMEVSWLVMEVSWLVRDTDGGFLVGDGGFLVGSTFLAGGSTFSAPSPQEEQPLHAFQRHFLDQVHFLDLHHDSHFFSPVGLGGGVTFFGGAVVVAFF